MKQEIESYKLHSNMLVDTLNKTTKQVRDLKCRVDELEIQCKKHQSG